MMIKRIPDRHPAEAGRAPSEKRHQWSYQTKRMGGGRDMTFQSIGTSEVTDITYSSLGMETSSALYSLEMFIFTFSLYSGWKTEFGSISIPSGTAYTMANGSPAV